MTREETIAFAYALGNNYTVDLNLIPDFAHSVVSLLSFEPKKGTLEKISAEKRHWIDADGDNAICSCCNRLNHLYGAYCKHCGTRMIESEDNNGKA